MMCIVCTIENIGHPVYVMIHGELCVAYDDYTKRCKYWISSMKESMDMNQP